MTQRCLIEAADLLLMHEERAAVEGGFGPPADPGFDDAMARARAFAAGGPA